MGFFTRNVEQEETKVNRLHQALTIAFDHVRGDFHKVTQWIHYFHQKHEQHDTHFLELSQRLELVEKSMAELPKSKEEIKQIINSYYSYEPIYKKIDELHAKIQAIESAKPHVEREEVRLERQSNLKERIISKITKNSKDYVKQVIMTLIQKYHSISGPQLKDIVVEEQGLCSKSSFYRLLEELEDEDALSVIQMGKEKTYKIKSPIQH